MPARRRRLGRRRRFGLAAAAGVGRALLRHAAERHPASLRRQERFSPRLLAGLRRLFRHPPRGAIAGPCHRSRALHQGHRLSLPAAAARLCRDRLAAPATGAGSPPPSASSTDRNTPAISNSPVRRWASIPPRATASSAGATSTSRWKPLASNALRHASEQLGARSPALESGGL